jgi:beta-glucanase (GH16 family)
MYFRRNHQMNCCMMYRISIVLFFLGTYTWNCNGPKKTIEPSIPAPTPQLVWQDEFDQPGLPDPAKWAYDVGDGCPNLCGWGNNEIQYYHQNRLANTRVEEGNLIIIARKEDAGGYTSTRLVTRGKAAWKYGKIVVKAKLPYGLGIWPAIWMLPVKNTYGGWPASGEIDIMENVGHLPNKVFASAHTKSFNHMIGTQSTNGIKVNNASTEFHEYAINWTAESIEYSIDNQVFHRFVNTHAGFEAWPFDQEFYLILNVAIGGNWGGQMGIDDNIWPQKMEIDYVRVYKN